MRGRKRAIGSLAVAVAFGAAPVGADWLVLSDGGGRVETRGSWEVRGGLVVFTSTAGTLSSLRASEVDLSASEQATAEALRPPAEPPPPAPRPKARVVLTERDLPPVPLPSEEEGETEGSAADGSAAPNESPSPAGGDSRLVVSGFDVSTPDDYDGTVVTGRLRNVSDRLLTRVSLEVTVFNASGTLLARMPADLDPGPVAPDRVVDFEARFPSLYGVTAARFDARGQGFLEGAPEGAGGAGAAATPAQSGESAEEPGPGT